MEVFSALAKERPDAFLLLIGGGTPTQGLLDKISSCEAGKRILTLSDRSDVPDLLQTMDVFVLPSHYEGFPMTLIEAQAAGLRCIVSDAVTTSSAITRQVSFLPLAAGKEAWADAIANGSETAKPEGSLADFDIANVIRNLEEYYAGRKTDRRV